MTFKYIFGPVMSGRLGRSLGLDLLGGRVCSMDCVYCEVGATRNLTVERKPYVPAKDILDELAKWKATMVTTPDAITLGGLGEPTLNSEMARIIIGARELFPDTDIAVLTNASLMTDELVRQELTLADIILPSLDSLVDDEFNTVNRPCKGMTPAAIAAGLLDFRKVFKGKIFLEILLAKGINDSDENLGKLKIFCKRLVPDRVDVVTLTRPGTLKNVHPVDGEVVSRWRKALNAGKSRADDRKTLRKEDFSMERATALIEASLARRPQTVLQLAEALNAKPETVRLAVETLERAGDIVACTAEGKTFYHGIGHRIEE
ncbi:MAG: radical SAM protein [Pseudodesulfovibrio sp.]|nr:radical SAM protein [Pseudodesulfovibrio sp.]